MKAFVSGGNGFIGTHLIKRLVKEGHEVTVFDNFSSEKKLYQNQLESKAKIIKGNLLDIELVKNSISGHDIVFHLASNSDIAKSMTDTFLDMKLGPVITYNILEAMRINEIKKIVYTSGSGVYGDQGSKILREDFGPLIPNSLYGASKLACEGLISAFCHSFDMQSWIIRPANIIGEFMTHGVILDFILKLKRNPKELLILGDGKQSKSYLYIDDLINGIFSILTKSDDTVNLYNVGSDTYIEVNEIAKIVTESIGLKNVQFKYTGGARGWKGDVPIVRLDIQKIRNLGWDFKHNSREAVKLTTEITNKTLNSGLN